MWCPAIYCASLKSLGMQAFQGKGCSTQPSALSAQHADSQQGCSNPYGITDSTLQQIKQRRNCLLAVSLSPSAQDHSHGMKNNPDWIIRIITAPWANMDTALTGYGASNFSGRMGSNPPGNWIKEEWTIPWFVSNVVEDTGWMLIRKKKILIINISMGSV